MTFGSATSPPQLLQFVWRIPNNSNVPTVREQLAKEKVNPTPPMQQMEGKEAKSLSSRWQGGPSSSYRVPSVCVVPIDVDQGPDSSPTDKPTVAPANNSTDPPGGSLLRPRSSAQRMLSRGSGNVLDLGPMRATPRSGGQGSHHAHVHEENAAFSAFAQQRVGYLPTFTSQPHHSAEEIGYVLHRIALYLLGTAPLMFRVTRKHKWLDFVVNAVPRGAGQVCFMNNPWSGLLMIIGLSIWSTPQYTLFGVGGLVISTSFAAWLRVGWAPIRSGLFGYNGILVGYSLPILMYGVNQANASAQALWSSVFAVVLFSCVAVILTVTLGNMLVPLFSCPPFTLPFNISAMLYYLAVGSSRAFVNGVGQPSFRPRLDPSIPGDTYWSAWRSEDYFQDGGEVVKAVFRGVSQVFLCDRWESGVLVVIALALCSRISAAMAVWGSAIGVFTGMFFGASKAAIFAGLWGYNSVLACIATGGMFFVLSWRTVFLCSLCAFLCAVFQGAFMVLLSPAGVTPLTMPFCLGTICFVLVQRSLPDFVPVPLASLTTPEEHLQRSKAAVETANIVAQEWKRITQCKQRAVAKLRRIHRGMVLSYPDSETSFCIPAAVLKGVVRRYAQTTLDAEVDLTAADQLIRSMVSDDVVVTLSPMDRMNMVTLNESPRSRVSNASSSNMFDSGGGMVPYSNIFCLDGDAAGAISGPNVVMRALEHVALVHELAHPNDRVFKAKPQRVWRLQPKFKSLRGLAHSSRAALDAALMQHSPVIGASKKL
jgi:urea transporter